MAGDMLPKLRQMSRSVNDRMSYEESSENHEDFPYDKSSVVWERKQIENSSKYETVIYTGNISITSRIKWDVEGELFRTTGETIFGLLLIDGKVHTVISYESKTGGFSNSLINAGFDEVKNFNEVLISLLILCNNVHKSKEMVFK